MRYDFECPIGKCAEKFSVTAYDLGTEQKMSDIDCPNCGRLVVRMSNPFYIPPGPTHALITPMAPVNAELPENLGWVVSLSSNLAYPIKEGRQTIGRKNSERTATIEIITEDKKMSGIHCQIDCKIGREGTPEFLLVDFNSTNGTWLNGTRLAKEDMIFLENSNIIGLGNTKFIFVHYPHVNHDQEIPSWLETHQHS